MEPHRFLGLNLNWTPQGPSTAAVMERTEEGVELISTSYLRAHEDVLTWIARSRGRGEATLVMNAPVVVENHKGVRPVDEQIRNHFSVYNVREYSVNTINASHPRNISKALIHMGFNPDPDSDSHRILETCTQAAQILLFGLDRALWVRGGPIGGRREAVHRYREYIYGKLPFVEPSLQDSDALEELMEPKISSLGLSKLDDLGSRLESTLCAFIAAYVHLRGLDACHFLGDLKSGLIVLPQAS